MPARLQREPLDLVQPAEPDQHERDELKHPVPGRAGDDRMQVSGALVPVLVTRRMFTADRLVQQCGAGRIDPLGGQAGQRNLDTGPQLAETGQLASRVWPGRSPRSQ